MLDNIAVGPLLEQPSRKDAVPLVVALLLHAQLHERTGFGRRFPWRRRFAGAQPDNGTAHPRIVAGAHFQILYQPVALVEQCDHGDALGHRRHSSGAALLFGRLRAGDFGFNLGRHRPAVGGLITPRQQQCGEANSNAKPPPHQLPGCHAS